MWHAIESWCGQGAWAAWILTLWVTLVTAGVAVAVLAFLQTVPRGAARNTLALLSVACAALGMCAAAPEFLAAFRPTATEGRMGSSEALATHVWLGATAMGIGLVLGVLGLGVLGVVWWFCPTDTRQDQPATA